jgi:outer membrane protein assembly factor BamB
MRRALAMVFLQILVIATLSAAQQWPMYQADPGGTGEFPWCQGPDNPVVRIWSNVGDVERWTTAPVVGPDGTVYVAGKEPLPGANASRYHIYALRVGATLQPEVLWRCEVGQYIQAPLLVNRDGTVFAVDTNGVAYGVSADGERIWSQTLAIDVARNWRATVFDPSEPEQVYVGASCPLAGSTGCYYEVIAVSWRTGNIQWRNGFETTTSPNGMFWRPLLLAQSELFVTATDDENNSCLWSWKTWGSDPVVFLRDIDGIVRMCARSNLSASESFFFVSYRSNAIEPTVRFYYDDAMTRSVWGVGLHDMAFSFSKHVLFAQADPETVNHEAYCAFGEFERSSPVLQWSFGFSGSRVLSCPPIVDAEGNSYWLQSYDVLAHDLRLYCFNSEGALRFEQKVGHATPGAFYEYGMAVTVPAGFVRTVSSSRPEARASGHGVLVILLDGGGITLVGDVSDSPQTR